MTTHEPAADVSSKRIFYIADPMCSWCWGFDPVIVEIAREAADRAVLRVVVGGLRPGTTDAMTDRSKSSIRHHWERVQAETGQPFTFSFFDRDGFVYDTEPACRAVVAVRSLRPDAALDYFRAVQGAFYKDNRDVTRAAELAHLAQPFGIDADTFATLFAAREVAEATRADFAVAPALGLSGFPSVLIGEDNSYAVLTSGYQPFAALATPLRQWLRT
jgi:putative protein-disulfide isomerase